MRNSILTHTAMYICSSDRGRQEEPLQVLPALQIRVLHAILFFVTGFL